jgi:four helix bundle protein
MSEIQNHKDLVAWQKSIMYVSDIYRLTALFPKCELYGLTSQMRRAAVSVPSNIAEGCARRGTKEFVRFIQIAKGSLAEMETQLIISNNLGYVEGAMTKNYLDKLIEIQKILGGLERKLAEKLQVTNH